MSTPALDIVQVPKWMKVQDLPVELSVDHPFEVDGELFVLTKGQRQELAVCSYEEGDMTSAPVQSGDYYIIKRLN